MTAQDDRGQTPLHVAAMLGNEDIVKMIIKHEEGRSAMEMKDSKGFTPMDLATENGHNSIVETLQADTDKYEDYH